MQNPAAPPGPGASPKRRGGDCGFFPPAPFRSPGETGAAGKKKGRRRPHGRRRPPASVRSLAARHSRGGPLPAGKSIVTSFCWPARTVTSRVRSTFLPSRVTSALRVYW